MGSLRDEAAVYNREPELFYEEVAHTYLDDGSGGGSLQRNPELDPEAYLGLMRSDLPISLSVPGLAEKRRLIR